MSRDSRSSRIFFLFPKVSRREIAEYNTYESDIIHRIGTKCLFTSSFELSKLGTISDLRLGSREVPRVRSVIYVSPSPKTRTLPTSIQTTFNPFLQTKHSLAILITTSDSLRDWIRDLLVKGERIINF